MKLGKMMRVTAALLVFAAISLTAGASTWETEDFTAQVPEGFYEFDQQTPADDPAWALAGVADPTAKLQEYQEMGALANFISEDGKLSILAMKKESSYSKQVYNLKELGEEERGEVLSRLSQTEGENFQVDSGYHTGAQVPFFYLDITGALEDETLHHELIYGTIVNGAAYTFDIYGGEEAISEEHRRLLLGIVDSLKFHEVLPIPEYALTPMAVVQFVLLMLVLIAVVAVPLIYIPMRKKSEKKKKAHMAQLLEEYRKTHTDEQVARELRFSNTTDCTKETIRAFSVYHVYVKNLVPMLLNGGLCVLAIVMTFALDSVWWMKLLAVGITVYFGYKVFTNPTTVEKVQRKVYQRGPSQTAIYSFYEEGFRVAGIQSAHIYPYFQLSAVKRHGRYFYLYYGPDNAYIVDQAGFKVGEAGEFFSFIKAKTDKKTGQGRE